MTDFTRTKITFTIALLATLFTISPLVPIFGEQEMEILGRDLPPKYVYYATAAYLALAVYFYAVQFLTERPLFFTNRLGDVSFAIAMVLPPLYAALFLVSRITVLARSIGQTETALVIVQVVLGGLVGVVSAVIVSYLQRAFARRERAATVEQYETRERTSLDRVRQLFEAEYYDLCVVECFRTVEMTLRKALFERRVGGHVGPSIRVVETAIDEEIIPRELVEDVQVLRRQRNAATHSVEPLSREEAEKALATASRLVASLTAVGEEPRQEVAPPVVEAETGVQ